MKAAVIRKYGKPNVFQIENVPEPSPQHNEVKIRVIASSVNPIDCKTRSGSLFFLSGWKFPRILGSDFCGVVMECGSSIKHLQPGDEVFGFTSGATKGGSYGEVICCQASRVAIKPQRLNAKQAATVPLAGLTAYQALYREGNLKSGMRVLITGATGGVGHFAVQISKAAKCHVTGVCHSKNTELAIQLGCNDVLPYDKADFRKEQSRYDIIFDAVAKYGYFSCRGNLLPKGTFISTIPHPTTMSMHVISRFNSGRKARFISLTANTAELNILSQMNDDGLVNPFIENEFPLSDIAKAHALSETEKVRGKIAILVSEGVE